ncbi:MAG: hypothetical protein OXN97_14445 [Bryobacterales bacterium]|nr:hypothetical protein [Bryobacterales bacterium]
MSLRRSLKIQTLAADLGLPSAKDPVGAILRFCENRTRSILRGFSDCHTLTDLLAVTADSLGTQFAEVRSDEELDAVRMRYARRGERVFAGLHNELSDSVYGITIRRTARKSWEQPYVSVIDCRGNKRRRSYFTKWHEVGHLLVLTDQMRLCFRRTHVEHDQKDPEEAMVDLIAGHVGFLPLIVRRHAKGVPSFGKFEGLRTRLCPEASREASIQGFAKAWPTPCLLIRAKLGLKRGEQRWLAQPSLGLGGEPEAVLRAVRASPNDAARRSGLRIFPNMQVPDRSVIRRVFKERNPKPRKDVENLSMWQSTGGKRLSQRKVLVQATSRHDGVDALVSPC